MALVRVKSHATDDLNGEVYGPGDTFIADTALGFYADKLAQGIIEMVDESIPPAAPLPQLPIQSAGHFVAKPIDSQAIVKDLSGNPLQLFSDPEFTTPIAGTVGSIPREGAYTRAPNHNIEITPTGGTMYVQPVENSPPGRWDPRSWGAKCDGSAELAAPFQAAYDMAAVFGGDVVIGGTPHVSDPTSQCFIKLTRDNVGTAPKVRILLEPGTVVKESALTPRFIDFNYVTTNDTFRNVELDGQWATIDADNVGGKHHVVIGTFQAGNNHVRCNFRHIRVRRIETINVTSANQDGDYAAATNNRINVVFGARQNNTDVASGGVDFWTEDVVTEDCRFYGGNSGAFIGTQGITAYTLGKVHNCGMRRCYHDCIGAPAQFHTGANFQLVGNGLGKHVFVDDCEGYNSGDSGLEIDQADLSVTRRTVIQDAFSGNFYVRSFNNTLSGQGAIHNFSDCRAKSVNITCTGWIVAGAGGGSFEAVNTYNCTYYKSHSSFTQLGSAFRSSGVAVGTVLLDNFRSVQVGADMSSASTTATATISFTSDGTATPCRLIIRDSEIKVSGVRSGAGALTWGSVQVSGGTFEVDIDRLATTFNMTGVAAGTHLGLILGPAGGGVTIKRASVRRYRPVVTGDDTAPWGARIGGQTDLTVNDRIRFSECDWAGLPVGGTEVVFSTNGGTNRTKVTVKDSGMKTGSTSVVASAAALTLPLGYETASVTGTTTVTSITAEPSGNRRTLIFSGAAQVTDNNGALNLAGNFTGPGTLTVVSDASNNWVETGRAAL